MVKDVCLMGDEGVVLTGESAVHRSVVPTKYMYLRYLVLLIPWDKSRLNHTCRARYSYNNSRNKVPTYLRRSISTYVYRKDAHIKYKIL